MMDAERFYDSFDPDDYRDVNGVRCPACGIPLTRANVFRVPEKSTASGVPVFSLWCVDCVFAGRTA